jgi:hypothetical protein
MLQTALDSARAVGVFKDFHVWTDRPIDGAMGHPLKRFNPRGGLFRLDLLYDQVRKLKYDYFVWLDADSFFVRNPGDVLRVLQGAPVHASLEHDAASRDHVQPDWQRCSLSNFTKLMRFNGVRSRGVFTVNSGFWIVHREVIENFCRLAWDFSDFCHKVGYRFGFEPLLAYATQMLCGNPYTHNLKHSADLWAVDRNGHYSGLLPDGRDWQYLDHFSGESMKVNSAIIHAMHSRRALAAQARKRLARPGSGRAGVPQAQTHL